MHLAVRRRPRGLPRLPGGSRPRGRGAGRAGRSPPPERADARAGLGRSSSGVRGSRSAGGRARRRARRRRSGRAAALRRDAVARATPARAALACRAGSASGPSRAALSRKRFARAPACRWPGRRRRASTGTSWPSSSSAPRIDLHLRRAGVLAGRVDERHDDRPAAVAAIGDRLAVLVAQAEVGRPRAGRAHRAGERRSPGRGRPAAARARGHTPTTAAAAHRPSVARA